jgi:hypothetical protein
VRMPSMAQTLATMRPTWWHKRTLALAVLVLGAAATLWASTAPAPQGRSVPTTVVASDAAWNRHGVHGFWSPAEAVAPAQQGVMDYLQAHGVELPRLAVPMPWDPAVEAVYAYLRAHGMY